MSEADIVAAHAKGHEIGGHTYSHLDGMAVGPKRMLEDVARNQDALLAAGLPRAETFAYPYGEVTPVLKRRIEKTFALSRGIHNPQSRSVDLGLAASARLYSSTTDTVLEQVLTAAREKRWLILFGHDVRDNPSEFGCTPQELSRVIDAVADANLDVMNVRDALAKVTA